MGFSSSMLRGSDDDVELHQACKCVCVCCFFPVYQSLRSRPCLWKAALRIHSSCLPHHFNSAFPQNDSLTLTPMSPPRDFLKLYRNNGEVNKPYKCDDSGRKPHKKHKMKTLNHIFKPTMFSLKQTPNWSHGFPQMNEIFDQRETIKTKKDEDLPNTSPLFHLFFKT